MDENSSSPNPFMDDSVPPSPGEKKSPKRKVVISAALIAAGLVAGAAVTTTVVANAHDRGRSSAAVATAAPSDSMPSLVGGDDDRGSGDDGAGEERRPRPEDISAEALAKVTTAVQARYPGSTIERAGLLPDGTYVAHVVTADGEKYVALDANFVVTGEVTGPPRPGGPDGDRDHGPDHRGSGDSGSSDDDGGMRIPGQKSLTPSADSTSS